MFLFSMVKHELIKPEVEKVRALGAVRSVAAMRPAPWRSSETWRRAQVWNARINVWLRSPGLVVGGYLMYLAITRGPSGTSCADVPLVSVIVGLFFFGNGQYYMQQVAPAAQIRPAPPPHRLCYYRIRR